MLFFTLNAIVHKPTKDGLNLEKNTYDDVIK